MVIEKFHNQADTEYQCNVHEFISTSERRELTRLENKHIWITYPEVGQWYESLDEEGKERGGTSFVLKIWIGRAEKTWD